MTDLNVKIANEAYVIYEALAEVADQQAHEQSLQTAIEHIVTYLQQLETEAQERQLAGLETVCQLTQSQLIHFDIQDHQHKQTLLHYIEQWPKIILDYLNNPQDLQMQAQLVHNLSQHAVADELPPLAELLAQDTAQLLAPHEQTDNAFEALVADEPYPSFEAEAAEEEPTPAFETLPSYPAAVESPPVLSETEWDKLLDETAFEALADEPPPPATEVAPEPQTAEPTPEVESQPQTTELPPKEETWSETSTEEVEQEQSLESSSIAETIEQPQPQEQQPAEETIPRESSAQFISGSPKQSTDSTELPSATQSINTLSNQIVELSDTLNQSLNQFVTLDEDSEVFLDALEHYTNALQSLWETAEKLGLKGFQEICTFINDNIFETSALENSERLALRTLFELWPQLVLDYLQSPSDNAPVLIEHLQQSTWPINLSEDKTKSLLVQLVQETVVPQIIEKTPGRPATPKTAEEPSTPQSSEAVPAQPAAEENFFKPEPSIPMNRPDWGEAFIEEDIHLAREADHEALWLTLEEDTTPTEPTASKPPLPAEDLEFSSAQIELASPEILDLLIAEISEAQHDLATALHHFMAADEDSAALLDAVEQYTDNVQSIWEAAGMANLSGLQTVCSLIKENMFELSTLARAVRRALGPHIEAWPDLVLAYLREPLSGAQTLVTYLSNPVWLLPLDEAQAQALLAQLTLEDTAPETIISVTEESSEVETEAPVESDTVFEVQTNEETATSETVLNTQLSKLNKQLPPIVENLTQADAGSETLAIAIEAYTDAVQSLWDAAEMADLVGLQDICTFINDNVIQLSEHSQSARLTMREVLATWPQLVQIYVYNPLEGIPRLINLLKQPYWPLALADSQIAVLENRLRIRDHLPQEELETTSIESAATEVAESSTDVFESTTSEIIETVDFSESHTSEVTDTVSSVAETVDIIEAAERVEPITDDTVARIEPQQQTPEQSFEVTVEETSEAAMPTLVDERIVPPALEDTLEDAKPLATTEVLNSIIDLLKQMSTALNESLALLCAVNEETFFTAVEIYTEYVQSLWDAGELTGLAGLQEVCLLMNDNIIQLAQLTPQQRQAVKPLFEVWPQWLLRYLQVPTATIQPLISYLQEEHWPTPLAAHQVELLQARLAPVAAESLTPTPEPELTPLAAEAVEEAPSFSVEETESILEEAELADPDVLALIIDQLTDIQAELIETSETLCNAETGSEALLTAIETYTEQVQSLWDAAEMAQLSGLQTLCTFINDNVMQIGQQSQRQAAQSLLATWPQLTLDYLQHPSATIPQLLDLVQDSRWPAPLETVAPLEQQLRPAAEHYLAPPETLEVISEQIKDVINGLSTDLEMCVSMENDNPDLLEAVENYTNQVQAIWDAADMAGLTGLQEVCTFVNENLMALSLETTETKVNAKSNFERWPALVLAYLQAPQTQAPQLVDLLKQSSWPQPLTEDKADALLNQLLQGTQSPQQQAAYEQEQLEEAAETEAEQPEKTDLALETTEEEISLGNAEALEILTSELESAKEELAQTLSQIKALPPNAPALKEHIEHYTDNVQRLHMAAEMLGLEGLQEVCGFIIDNINALAEQDQAGRDRAHTVLQAWPDLVLAYLQAPMSSVIPMVNHFREPQWPQALPDEQAHALLTLLTQGSTVDEAAEEAAYSRQTQAQPEDVRLNFPEDVNADLLQAYLQEVPQHASDFSGAIQSIIREPVIAEIERAQRIAHTLKGSSNIIGIKGIANIAHHLEDTLEYLAQHKVAPPKPLTDTMVEAADCIEMMVDALLGQEAAPPQAQGVLQAVLDWANRIDKGNLDAPPASTRPPEPEAQPQPAPAAQPAAAQTQTTQAAAGSPATPEQVLRVPTKTIDELMRLVGELSISVGQIQERLKHIIQNTRVLADHDTVLQHKIFELENLVDVRGIGVERNYQREDELEEDFDPLEFEEYNELYSVTHSFIEAIADNRELTLAVRNDLSELESMFVHQERLNKEFQTNVMTTRMVPVNTITAKLQRNVRQTCRATGKQAELTIDGADILMDSDVLNNLADPLQHVLRNAIDHGLETPQERALVGKPEVGQIQLRFYREGNNIVVSCQDDGQGLNYANIRYTAVQRNLIKQNQELTETELARLILTSGFSTKSGVTQVSGRGVGMDVVHTNIRQMKGTLDLISQTGQGMHILIKLPMTLVTVHVLIVRLGQHIFGIPSNYLEQVLAPGVGELRKVGEEINFKLGKHIYALKSLAELLNVASDKTDSNEHDPRPIMLAREETGITAIVVDEVIDTHDLVMKSMGAYVKHIRGVAGASILGDGNLIPLLDLPELLRSPMQAVMSSYFAEHPEEDRRDLNAPALPHIMIVDDSLSVRKSLSLLIEEAGYEALLAKDGLEAIEVINQTRPNVMLVDMEMPRMNGLELTAHIRANKATENIPIFMITSRTTEKHREQAKSAGVSAYLTKPYQDTELLDLIDKGLAGTL